MDVGLNVNQEDGSQAVRSEVVRIFMNEKENPSAAPIGGVSCKPEGIKSVPSNLS